MKKVTAIALASLAALTLASCNRSKDTAVDPAVEPAPTDTSEDVAVADGTATDDVDSEEGDEDKISSQIFNVAPGVIQTDANPEAQIPGLIPSTDPGLRLKAVGQGRQDPFSGRVILVRPLPPDPAVIDDTDFALPDETTTASQGFFPGSAGASDTAIASRGSSATVGSGATVNRASGGTQTASRGTTSSSASSPKTASRSSSSGSSSGSTKTASRGSSSQTSGSSATVSRGSSSTGKSGSGTSTTATSSGSSSDSTPTPQIAAGPSDLPDLTPREPIPDPALARAVEVTGVIQVGSLYQAIVKAPDEPTSRYVSVGQRLSNGRVLVKRIESNGSEPVVILEESGVEVVRAIGAPNEGDTTQETATLPVPPASI